MAWVVLLPNSFGLTSNSSSYAWWGDTSEDMQMICPCWFQTACDDPAAFVEGAV